jgi:carbon-monoxide dehydrogenase medium subunit
VKPPKFDYHAPVTLDEAIALLVRYGGDAKLLAGGQSLVPLLNFRLARPAALIDLNRIKSLSYIREHDGQVRFGAMTRQRAIEFSPVVARRVPLLREATRWVGHLPIRSRGTIGGSIAHADPSAEYPAVLTALDGEVVAAGRSKSSRDGKGTSRSWAWPPQHGERAAAWRCGWRRRALAGRRVVCARAKRL